MEDDLKKDELLRRDVNNLMSSLNPCIPYLGLLSSGITVGKHVCSHMYNKVSSDPVVNEAKPTENKEADTTWLSGSSVPVYLINDTPRHIWVYNLCLTNKKLTHKLKNHGNISGFFSGIGNISREKSRIGNIPIKRPCHVNFSVVSSGNRNE